MRGLFCAGGRAPARASEEKWLPKPERYSKSPPAIGFSMIHGNNNRDQKEREVVYLELGTEYYKVGLN